MKSQLFTFYVVAFTISFGFAQECSKDLELVNALLEKANLEQVINNPDAIADDFKTLKSSLGSIGLKSLKKDAPKLLLINGKERKLKVRNGERQIFVTTLITGDSLQLKLLNPEMAHGIEVIICSHNTSGKAENLADLFIEQNNTSEEFDFAFDRLNSSVVSIAIRNSQNSERVEFGITAHE